jgi:hypothetical protein
VAKSVPGMDLVPARPDPDGQRSAERASQAVADGRRGQGSIVGAFQPTDGEAFTHADPRRTLAHWIDFLEPVEAWIPPESAPVAALLANLNVQRATAGRLFAEAHPRGEVVFTPTSAASLNVIEPWGKMIRSLALQGRRFQTWEELAPAVQDATAYWNQHRHPFIWGRRRRHQPHRRSGVGLLPKVA